MTHNIQCRECKATASVPFCELPTDWNNIQENQDNGPAYYGTCPTCHHPEHEKLTLVRDKSQAIGEFLEWLPTQGIHLCTFHYQDNQYRTAYTPITELLAKFFDIDLDKLENEKLAMLDSLRRRNIIT